MERFGNSAGDTEITVTKTMEQALKECEEQFNRAMSDKDPSTTYWVDIGYNDENDFAVVMCYMDEDSAESYGYDGESDFVQAKFAYCPRNSMMNEYEWDWLMPYPVNEYDDTLDTDMSIYSADSSDFGWILDEGYKFIDEFNANLPADEDDWDEFDDEDSDLTEGCHGGKKKKKKKVLNQKKVCGEDRMYDLAPQKRDSRKSFYGKAKVVDKGNGEYELISYNTPVACVKDGKVVYADLRKYSATTDRHIREFLAQFCDECEL